MSKRKNRNSKRNRKLRLRLLDAGNTRCPICLSTFSRADVLNGKVTLEHAPPESLNGSVVCLTCERCNNNASQIDHHAFLSKKATDDWSSGRGAPVEVDFLGHRISSRYIPNDPKSPLPVRVRDLRKGTIKIGALPPRERLDLSKGIRFRIPMLRHFEKISLIKSAYLMVFSLMGNGGYHFAENVALEPVREQIMNPEEIILKGAFVVNGVMDGTSGTKRNLITLYRVYPSCWMVPLWNNNVVVLPCGGSKPIDEFVFPKESFSIPTEMFSFWASCRFDSSVPMVGSVIEESSVEDESLVGRIDQSPTIAKTGEEWHWMVVFHHNRRYVALPCGSDDERKQSGFVKAVEMLNANLVAGSGMDKSILAGINREELSKERTIHIIRKETPKPEKDESEG